MDKIIGISGLGLIGGSMAKALKSGTTNIIYGYDINDNTVQNAIVSSCIDGVLDENTIKKCDIIILCLYPSDTINYVISNIKNFKKNTIIVDCAGVKTNICETLSKLCFDNGIHFIGGHPMAGIEKSGFENSFSHMFDGATMIFCKDNYTNLASLKTAEKLFNEIGFLRVTITTANEHDRVIAFTSQLPHVVSNAFIKSPTALEQIGYSAGSYKDLTRVALLNEDMWTELFFQNKDCLLEETKSLVERLNEYINALENDDKLYMKQLLFDGKKAKEKLG